MTEQTPLRRMSPAEHLTVALMFGVLAVDCHSHNVH